MVLACAIFAALQTSAAAQGFYVGANLGNSVLDGVANADPIVSTSFPPSALTIDGRRYDGRKTMWGLFGGWAVNDWVSVELGYTDLGETSSKLGIGFVGQTSDSTQLEIEEWSLGAKFRVPIGARLSLHGLLGVSRAKFEAGGREGVFRLSALFGSPFSAFVPFGSPDDETGSVLGVGLDWSVIDRIGLGLGYRQHDTQVLEVDAVSISISYFL